jgi:hypothetical protein
LLIKLGSRLTLGQPVLSLTKGGNDKRGKQAIRKAELISASLNKPHDILILDREAAGNFQVLPINASFESDRHFQHYIEILFQY